MFTDSGCCIHVPVSCIVGIHTILCHIHCGSEFIKAAFFMFTTVLLLDFYLLYNIPKVSKSCRAKAWAITDLTLMNMHCIPTTTGPMQCTWQWNWCYVLVIYLCRCLQSSSLEYLYVLYVISITVHTCKYKATCTVEPRLDGTLLL